MLNGRLKNLFYFWPILQRGLEALRRNMHTFKWTLLLVESHFFQVRTNRSNKFQVSGKHNSYRYVG